MGAATTVACAQQKGGTGKSTLAAHAAGWLRKRGESVCLVDADVSQGSSRFLSEALDDAVHLERLDNADDLLEGLPELARQFDRVIVDCPGGDDEAVRNVLFRCDLVLCPTGPGVLDLRALSRTARIIKQVQSVRGGPPEALAVLNRLRRGTKVAETAREVVADCGLPLAKAELAERAALADCIGHRVLVWDLPSGKDAAHEIEGLFAEVFGDE